MNNDELKLYHSKIARKALKIWLQDKPIKEEYEQLNSCIDELIIVSFNKNPLRLNEFDTTFNKEIRIICQSLLKDSINHADFFNDELHFNMNIIKESYLTGFKGENEDIRLDLSNNKSTIIKELTLTLHF